MSIFCGVLLTAIEYAAQEITAPWVYRVGPRLSNRWLPGPDELDLTRLKDSEGTLGALVYRHLDANTWLFAGSSRRRAGWSFRAVLTIVNGKRQLEVRGAAGLWILSTGLMLVGVAGFVDYALLGGPAAELGRAAAALVVGAAFRIGPPPLAMFALRSALKELT